MKISSLTGAEDECTGGICAAQRISGKARGAGHFLTGSFIFLELNCRSCLYIFESNPLSVASFAMEMSKSQGKQTQMKRTNMDTKGAGVGRWEDWD